MRPEIADVLPRLGQRDYSCADEVAGWSRTCPQLLPELLLAAIAQGLPSTTVIDDIVSLVDDEALAEAVQAAMDALRGGADPVHSQAAGVIERVALQRVHLLHPHLETIWQLGVNEPSSSFAWPWREASDEAEIRRLLSIVGSDDDWDMRRRGISALVATRAAGVLEQVLPRSSSAEEPWLTPQEWARSVAWDLDPQGTLRPLTLGPAHHLGFPAGFVEHFPIAGVDRPATHPTWDREGTGCGTATFGGSVEGECPACGGVLSRLLTLDPVPEGLAVSEPVELVACLRCLEWGEEHVTHEGLTATVVEAQDEDEEYGDDVETLPQTMVSLMPSSPRWQVQDWGVSNGRENLHRLGGEPSWVQSADYPDCPECDQAMPFLLQLDSLRVTDGGEWAWGSGGILYVFWCDACRRSAIVTQCT